MTISGKSRARQTLLLKPLISIALLVCLTIGTFLVVSQLYMKDLFVRIEARQEAGLKQIISIARNSMEPILAKVRSGEVSRKDAIEQIRVMIRNMTYEDQYGKNYIVMNNYDGINLVHPFEPEKEMGSDLDVRDVNGFYIVKALINAAKTHPEGSFLRYVYFLPNVYANQ